MKTEWMVTPAHWQELEHHELACLADFGSGIDVEKLVSHIKEHGYDQDEAVIMFEGKILDHRHVHAACRTLGIVPVFKLFCGKSPLAYVQKKAFRQHLSPKERARIAAGMTVAQGGAQKSTLHVSQVKAARLMKVSRASVQRALKGPEREPGVETDDPPVQDRCGNTLPDSMAEAFQTEPFKAFKKAIAEAIKAYIEYVKHPSGKAMRQHGRGKKIGDKFVHFHLFYLNRYLNDSEPWELCPECDGQMNKTGDNGDGFVTKECQKCKGRGFLTKCESKGTELQAIRYDAPKTR